MQCQHVMECTIGCVFTLEVWLDSNFQGHSESPILTPYLFCSPHITPLNVSLYTPYSVVSPDDLLCLNSTARWAVVFKRWHPHTSALYQNALLNSSPVGYHCLGSQVLSGVHPSPVSVFSEEQRSWSGHCQRVHRLPDRQRNRTLFLLGV